MARPSALSISYAPTIKGVDRLLARLANMPEAAQARLAKAIDQNADDLVANMIAIAPRGDEPDRGEVLAEHIHKGPGRTPLARQVIADAKDEKGRGKAPHIEFGHRAPDGAHVAPLPFFYPTIRRRKNPMRARVARAISQAVKEAGQ